MHNLCALFVPFVHAFAYYKHRLLRAKNLCKHRKFYTFAGCDVCDLQKVCFCILTNKVAPTGLPDLLLFATGILGTRSKTDKDPKNMHFININKTASQKVVEIEEHVKELKGKA